MTLILPIFIGTFSYNVKADTTSITLVDWDSESTGVYDGDVAGSFVTLKRMDGTDTSIINEYIHSSPNSFYGTATDSVSSSWINLTRDFPAINTITLYTKFNKVSTSDDSTTFIRFYNNNIKVIDLTFLDVDDKIQIAYLGTDLVYHALSGVEWVYNAETECIINMTYIGTANQMRYNVTSGVSTDEVDGTTCNISKWTTFDSIFFSVESPTVGHTVETWLDDIIIDVDSDPYGEGEQQTQICSGKPWINVKQWYASSGYHNNYMEIEYFSKVNGIIKSADIYFRKSAYDTLGYTLSDFNLVVNGVNVNNPEHLIDLGTGIYILRWEFTVSAGNKKPIFEFSHSDNIWSSIGYGWTELSSYTAHAPITYYSASVHQNDFFYGDGIIQGSEWGYQYTSDYPDMVPKFEFCYSEGIIYDPYGDAPYTIWTDKYSYSLPDDNQVKIGYSMPTSTALLRLYKDSVEVKTSGFPLSINTFSGNYLYEPFESGSYLLSIMIAGSEQINTSFVVNPAGDGSTIINNMISSTPNPSYMGNSYNVLWRYDGINGRIYTGYNSDASDSVIYYMIPNNRVSDNGSISVQSVAGDNVYWFLVNYTNLTTYSFVDSHNHLFIELSKRPYLHVRYNLFVQLDETKIGLYAETETTVEEGSIREFILEGYHPFPLNDVFVYANNEIISKVDSSFSISLLHDYLIEARFYNFTLRATINNTNTIIAYYRITFIDNPLTADTEPDIFGLPVEYMKAMFGAFITLGFLLLPLVINIKSKGDVSGVIYAIFGGIGLGVSTLAGFFPLWLPLMITILVVTILIIEYKKGK